MILVHLGIWFGQKALVFESPHRMYPDGELLNTAPLWSFWQWIYWHKAACAMDWVKRCNKISWHQTDHFLGQGGYVKMSILWHKDYCQLITQDHAVTLHSDINGPVVVILQLGNNNSSPLHQPCSDCWWSDIWTPVPWLWLWVALACARLEPAVTIMDMTVQLPEHPPEPCQGSLSIPPLRPLPYHVKKPHFCHSEEINIVVRAPHFILLLIDCMWLIIINYKTFLQLLLQPTYINTQHCNYFNYETFEILLL